MAAATSASGRLRRTGLQKFLQFALGIFERRYDFERAKSGMELGENKPTRNLEPGIQKDRSQQRFKSIRQGRRTLTAPMKLFAPADDEEFSQAETLRVIGEGSAIDHFRPGFG